MQVFACKFKRKYLLAQIFFNNEKLFRSMELILKDVNQPNGKTTGISTIHFLNLSTHSLFNANCFELL